MVSFKNEYMLYRMTSFRFFILYMVPFKNEYMLYTILFLGENPYTFPRTHSRKDIRKLDIKEAISNVTRNLMESLILAQDERWRHA